MYCRLKAVFLCQLRRAAGNTLGRPNLASLDSAAFRGVGRREQYLWFDRFEFLVQIHWRDPSSPRPLYSPRPPPSRERRDSVWVRRSYHTYLRGSRRFLYEVSGWGLLLVVSAPEGIKLPSMASVGQETIATKIRVPGGNFRLLARLLTQIERILKINDFNCVTRFVVETARETLVIGSTQPHLSWNNSPKII